MSPDPRRLRNALVVSGVLLLFYGLLGIVYAEALRSDDVPCGDGGLARLGGACYAVWLTLLPGVVAGTGLLLGGLLGVRVEHRSARDELYLSVGIHATAWVLSSLVVLPLLALAIQSYRAQLLNTVFIIELVGIPFKHSFLLTLSLALALFAWIPFMALLTIRSIRWRIFLARYEAQVQEAD